LINNYHHITVINIIQNFIQYLSHSFMCPYIDQIIGTISVGFDITDQVLIRFFCIHQILEKKWEYSEPVHQLFIDFKKAYDSVKRKALYSILT
jgi:hypothetical protein